MGAIEVIFPHYANAGDSLSGGLEEYLHCISSARRVGIGYSLMSFSASIS